MDLHFEIQEPSSTSSRYDYYVYFGESQDRPRLAFFLRIGLSLSCWNSPDVRGWNGVAVCTEISSSTSKTCKWEISDKSQTRGYTIKEGSVSFSSTSTDNARVLWNCSVRYQMPPSSGSYLYNVYFAESQDRPRLAFTLLLDQPGEPTLNNCPQSVKDNVTCECTTQREGDPPPVLSWRWQTTSALHLNNADLDHTETNYTCEMIWGRRKKTALYSFIIKKSSGR